MTTQITTFTKENVKKVIVNKINQLKKTHKVSMTHNLICQEQVDVLMEILKKLDI